jgi:hypothetical protein
MKRALGVLLAALATSACGSSGPEFRASHVPEYAARPTVSVMGVWKDGLLSPDVWGELGSSILGRSCPAGYTRELVTKRPDLASLVDAYVRRAGVTDALLAEWEQSAKGDAILLLTISGHPPVQTGPAEYSPKLQNLTMTKSASSYNVHVPTDGSVFQVTASIYSSRLHRTVAQFEMKYGGHDVEAALAEFGRRMQMDLPIAGCAGWNPDTQGVDEERIRALKDD